MKMLSPEYIAGIIDGEGCITFQPKDGCLYCRIAVEMSYKEIIDLLYEQFGGGFSERQREVKHKIVYKWTLSTIEVIKLLKIIVPFLIVKKKQAELVLDFYDLGTIDNMKINALFVSEMHTLNKKGT